MELIYISVLTFFASGVGTLTGFGTSTIMVPILLLFYPLPETLLLVGIIHWCGDIWKIILFRQGIRWKLIIGFGIVGIVASFLGASLTFVAPKALLLRILGSFLVLYVIFLFTKSSFKLPQNNFTAVSGGALSGFFAGLFGVGGAVRGMALTAFDLPKAVYIATAGVIALFIDTTRIATYIAGGRSLPEPLLWGFIAFIPCSFLGAAFAKKIVDKIPQRYFRIVVAIFLLIVGLKLAIFPHL
jgi:hypothetical protein